MLKTIIKQGVSTVYETGTGFLGTRASFAADVDLILQIIIILVLSYGGFKAKKADIQFTEKRCHSQLYLDTCLSRLH